MYDIPKDVPLIVCVCSGGYSALARDVSFLSPRHLSDWCKLTSLRACTILTPIMASRLMLSLRKVAIKPRGPWSHTATSYSGRRGVPEGGTLYLVPPTLIGSHENLETPQNEENIELEHTPQLPQLLKPVPISSIPRATHIYEYS